MYGAASTRSTTVPVMVAYGPVSGGAVGEVQETRVRARRAAAATRQGPLQNGSDYTGKSIRHTTPAAHKLGTTAPAQLSAPRLGTLPEALNQPHQPNTVRRANL